MYEDWLIQQELDFKKNMMLEDVVHMWTFFVTSIFHFWLSMYSMMNDNKYWVLFLVLGWFYYFLCILCKKRYKKTKEELEDG